MSRRLILLLVVGAVGVIALAGTPPSARASANGCAEPCDGSQSARQSLQTPQSVRTTRSTPDPCVRDAGCGGGAALGFGSGLAAVFLVGTVTVATALTVWRTRRPRRLLRSGRTSAGGLFRPPQALLGL